MSVVIDNSNGSFLSEVETLKELIGITDHEIFEWKYLYLAHKIGLDEVVTKLNNLNEEFDFLYESNPIEHVETRMKSPRKTAEKLIRLGLPVTAESAWKNLHDVGGIRVICSFVEDVYEVFDKLSLQKDVTIREVKDYIRNPKGNGYRSMHVLVEVPVLMMEKEERVTVEVQIRTIAMDVWASLEHKLYYKKGKQVPQDMLDGLKECADLAAALDNKMMILRNLMEPYQSEEERAEQAAFLKECKEALCPAED